MGTKELIERTVVIIKPDAVERKLVGQILSRLESSGLALVELRSVRWTKSLAMSYFWVHRARPFLESLVAYWSRSQSIAVLLEGEDAINRARTLVGATNPEEAAPGTIRAEFGLSIESNAVVSSDSPQGAQHDIGFFFRHTGGTLIDMPAIVDPKVYDAALISRLSAILPGRNQWAEYQELMAEICTHLFSEELAAPIQQAPPRSSSRRLDLVLYNASQRGFWNEIRHHHSANLVVFEFKNQEELGHSDIDQVSAYLKDIRGSFAIVTCRSSQNKKVYRNLAALYQSSNLIIIPIDDSLIIDLLYRKEEQDRILRDLYMRCIFDTGDARGNISH